MKFEYYDYNEDLFANSIENKPAIYVFSNFNNLLEAKKHYQKPFLQLESQFMTLSDFKEKLLAKEKIILREEKLPLLIYQLLKDNEKEQLKINSYADVIEFSAKFLNFFNELAEYQIEKLNYLESWQEERFQLLKNIYQRYQDYLDREGFTDQTLIKLSPSLNLDLLEEYSVIKFINIRHFTPFEKMIIREINFLKNVKIVLQLFKEDYNESDLEITQLTFPEEIVNEIKINQVEEDIFQVFNLLNEIEDQDKVTILDPNFNNNNYHRFLSSQEINFCQDYSFTETRIFQFLSLLQQIYNNSKHEKNIKLPVKDILLAANQKVFSHFYRLSLLDKEILKELASEEYVYLDKRLLNDQLSSLLPLLNDLQLIRQINTIEDFINFITGLNLDSIQERNFTGEKEKLLDSLLELKAINKMNLVSDWATIFNDKPQGIFSIIINYLRYKKIKRENEVSADIICEDFYKAADSQRNKLIILNAIDGILPAKQNEKFLLNEKQKEKNGLLTYKQQKLFDKYIFFRSVLSSKEVSIFAINNLEENLTPGGFLEELRFKYNLPYNDSSLDSNDLLPILSKIFNSGQACPEKLLGISEEDDFVIEKTDFGEKPFSLSYYKYKKIKDCYYRFYLESIIKLTEEIPEFNKSMSNRIFGNFAHDFYERLFQKVDKNLKLDEESIKVIANQLLSDYELKIDKYYYQFYEKFIINKLSRSFVRLTNDLKAYVNGEIEVINTEWQPSRNNKEIFLTTDIANFYLNGRLDLIIKTSAESYLIDFKTGKGDLEQLSFYELMLDQKSEAYKSVKKSIYQILEERLKHSLNDVEQFAAALKEQILTLVNSDKYTRIYKSRCKSCPYYEICRVVVK